METFKIMKKNTIGVEDDDGNTEAKYVEYYLESMEALNKLLVEIRNNADILFEYIVDEDGNARDFVFEEDFDEDEEDMITIKELFIGEYLLANFKAGTIRFFVKGENK